MKKKIWLICILVVIIVAIIISLSLRQNAKLSSLEKEIANISLPQGVELIAIKSAIGDSGGNGNYSTLRVVIVVKSVLNIDELKDEFDRLDLRFQKHYESRSNNPIYYITHCEGSSFHSSRDFSLSFEELASISDYRDYYFLEFVE